MDAEESLDGSSIKPVSSLRSFFEQMPNTTAHTNSGPRAVSPQPAGTGIRNTTREISTPDRQDSLHSEDGLREPRGRDRPSPETRLRPPRPSPCTSSPGSTNASPSPTRILRPRPLSVAPPQVNILPPQSPPKARTFNLSLSSAPTHLSTASPFPTPPGNSSPKHFRIPSRPHTPLLDPGKSPKLPVSQPPSPPPPRRSGELRRDSSLKNVPPPINRSEKPKIASKPTSLKHASELTPLTALEPGQSRSSMEKSSPFSTPPSSDSSPEHELPEPVIPHSRTWNIGQKALVTKKSFEPPPVHHAIASMRKDQDTNGLGRGLISPQTTGEQRPALPTRPRPAPENVRRQPSRESMMPPPPPRPSMDRTRQLAVITANADVYAAPPKRVVSTPTTQLQTPPRTHGRSMTVDRTSERAPPEFRTMVRPLTVAEGRATADIIPSTPIIETLQPNLGEYPDTSQSNRRPPHFKVGAREIATKYETRILDVCGEFVCTSGHLTRVWSLLDGELITSLAHTEGTKIVSVVFKPSLDIKGEGGRLWLGNNIGDIYEVDVLTQGVIATKISAHNRREIIKMYRHLDQIWTLDDGGSLHLWAPDNSGSPSLTNPYQTFRCPKGHTFSLVVGNMLWYASGKEIRVFLPSLDGSTQFQVLRSPLTQPNTGDVTSGAIINSHPDRIYFGHTDGKVSIYSTRDYTCIGVVNISVYKITTLAGVGGDLWAGFSTGMVYVYDTNQTPWVVKKEWHAHQEPVLKLIADRSSPWTLNRAQVISLGQDNMLKVWDGLLQEDWIENQMHSQEADYCQLDTIKTLVMTWNAGASTPYHLQHSGQDGSFFGNLVRSGEIPDILVFGFQELVDLEDKKTVTKSFFKKKKTDPSTDQEHISHQYRAWRDYLTGVLDDNMPNELYHLLHTSSLVGLFTCIFVRAHLRERIRGVSGAEVKRGMGGALGNKGALVVRFLLDDTSLCFVNCHLAAGQSQTKDRNTDATMILESSVLPAERDVGIRQDSFVGGGDGSMIMDHDICILNGDLNYRIDTMGRDTVVNTVKANNLGKLLERDQLLASKRKNPWFKLRAFHELPITFAPTYKYDVGTDNYDTSEKKRAPAWCDRVLYRGKDKVKQLDYQRHEVRVSDHRPVTASFEMVIKKVSPKRRAMKWDECQNKKLERNQKLGYQAKFEYLTDHLGFDAATAEMMIQKQQK